MHTGLIGGAPTNGPAKGLKIQDGRLRVEGRPLITLHGGAFEQGTGTPAAEEGSDAGGPPCSLCSSGSGHAAI
ncbi:uncharacterized protein ACO6RY_13758 [Pungitius sinensis]